MVFLDNVNGPQQIATDASRILELARAGNLSTPVEHLGRWKVRDVVAHLGGIHRWAARIVAERSMAGPGARKSKLDGEELCDWFAEGATALTDLLAATGPDEACPNFNPGSERTVGWWVRRQLHETSVHGWDVEAAHDSIGEIDAGLATDGIDEFLDVFVRTRGKQTLQSELVLTASEAEQSWTLTPAAKPGRIDVTAGRNSSGEKPTEVAGTAAGLYLALWGRRSVEQTALKIDGDTAAAASLLRLE